VADGTADIFLNNNSFGKAAMMDAFTNATPSTSKSFYSLIYPSSEILMRFQTELLFSRKDSDGDDDDELEEEPPASKTVKAKKGRGESKTAGTQGKKGKGKGKKNASGGDSQAPATTAVSSSTHFTCCCPSHENRLGFHCTCPISFQLIHCLVYHHHR
jgi:hypothetical protein